MNLNINKGQLVIGISAIISLLVYLFHPTSYHYGYTIYCLIHFLGSSLLFFRYKKKDNYFDFDTIFLISYFVTFFTYPVFIYPFDPAHFFMFNYDFNENVVSQATALSLLGSQMYLLGSVSYKDYRERKVLIKDYPLKPFVICTIALFALFILAGGYTYYRDLYASDTTTQSVSGTAVAYINMLLKVFILITLPLQFNKLILADRNKLRISYVNKGVFIFIVIYILLLLSTGSRGGPLQVLLILMGLYSMFYNPVSMKLMVPLVCIGALGLSFISYTRAGGEFQVQGVLDVFMDLIVVNRNSYLAVDYVQTNGITLGRSMLAYILQPIPFAQGIVFNAFDIDPRYASSAMMFSVQTLGDNPSFGVGTNIIADIYLAFGLLGVIMFMGFGGYFVAKVSNRAKTYNMKYTIIYSILISLSVYTVRAEFFYCLYMILWSELILLITKSIFKQKS